MTGEPAKVYAKPATMAAPGFQHFCPECGSPLFTSGDGGPDDWGIRWGSIRQRDQLKPMRQIWCRSAAPWIHDLRGIAGAPNGLTWIRPCAKGRAGLNTGPKGG